MCCFGEKVTYRLLVSALLPPWTRGISLKLTAKDDGTGGTHDSKEGGVDGAVFCSNERHCEGSEWYVGKGGGNGESGGKRERKRVEGRKRKWSGMQIEHGRECSCPFLGGGDDVEVFSGEKVSRATKDSLSS